MSEYVNGQSNYNGTSILTTKPEFKYYAFMQPKKRYSAAPEPINVDKFINLGFIDINSRDLRRNYRTSSCC
jgi:hypothetical protein